MALANALQAGGVAIPMNVVAADIALADIAVADIAAGYIGTAFAVNSATTLSAGQAGALVSVSQSAAYTVTCPLPSAAMVGARYRFVVVAAGVFNVGITCGGNNIIGSIVNGANGATSSTVVCNGTTITLATGAAAIGDSVELTYISATQVHARCFTSAAAGITVA